MSAVSASALLRPAPSDARGRSVGWWGMVLLITTEATIFASLLAAYFFIRAASPAWPTDGIKAPELSRIIVFSVILVASSIPIVLAESAVATNRIPAVRRMLLLSFLMGFVFLINQALEYHDLEFTATTNAYGSLFIVITGLHGLHVLIGLLMSIVVQIKVGVGRITAARHDTLRIFGLYWHFVDGVWLFVFTCLYLSPHLG